MTAIKGIGKRVLKLYQEKKVSQASTALSYYLTLTVFPLIICLYALFGQNEQAAMVVYDYIAQFLTDSAAELIKAFLLDVSSRSSPEVLIAAIITLAFSASSGIRIVQSTISDMQGGRRFKALTDYIISYVLAAALVLAAYFSIAVLVLGSQILDRLQSTFGIILADSSWLWIRFILLGGMAFLLLWALFAFARRREDRYRVWPGTVLASMGIVAMSGVFSTMIASSSRYSLVYGALASLVLLMFWLYLMNLIILAGAAFNVALRDEGGMAEEKDG